MFVSGREGSVDRKKMKRPESVEMLMEKLGGDEIKRNMPGLPSCKCVCVGSQASHFSQFPYL